MSNSPAQRADTWLDGLLIAVACAALLLGLLHRPNREGGAARPLRVSAAVVVAHANDVPDDHDRMPRAQQRF